MLQSPLEEFKTQVKKIEDQLSDDIKQHQEALQKFEKVKQQMLEFDPDFKYEKPDKVLGSEKALEFVSRQRLEFDTNIQGLAKRMDELFKEFI